MITISELKERFKEYNKLYFNKELRMPAFKLFKGKYTVGMYFHYGLHGPRKVKEIWIAKNVDWTEETLKEIIVHEMIHYYLGMKGYSPRRHGRRFNAKCKDLYEKHNLVIHKKARHIQFNDEPHKKHHKRQ